MKKTRHYAISVVTVIAALLGGCASTVPVEGCCSKPDVVHVDKPVAECSLGVQKTTQVHSCRNCTYDLASRSSNTCVSNR